MNARAALAEVRKYNVHPRLDIISAALDRLEELEKEASLEVSRDALKARVEELEDGFFGRMAALLRTERDQLRADALAHMELAGQLRARVTELETREKWLENQWECATKGWVTDSEALRTSVAKLEEANRLLREGEEPWNHEGGETYEERVRAHLAKEEPAKKVIRRADTPESRAFWAQAEKEGGECTREWKVVGKKFVRVGGGTMEASCHHKSGSFGACGGCYARMAEVLEEILVSEDPKAVVRAVHAELIAEGKE